MMKTEKMLPLLAVFVFSACTFDLNTWGWGLSYEGEVTLQDREGNKQELALAALAGESRSEPSPSDLLFFQLDPAGSMSSTGKTGELSLTLDDELTREGVFNIRAVSLVLIGPTPEFISLPSPEWTFQGQVEVDALDLDLPLPEDAGETCEGYHTQQVMGHFSLQITGPQDRSYSFQDGDFEVLVYRWCDAFSM